VRMTSVQHAGNNPVSEAEVWRNIAGSG
jgi:hypothetical protein